MLLQQLGKAPRFALEFLLLELQSSWGPIKNSGTGLLVAKAAVPFSEKLSLPRLAELLFWLSRIFPTLGFQVASVAVGWLGYARTGSAYALDWSASFNSFPMVALTFLVEYIADRLDSRRIIATCQSFECVVMALLTLGDRDGKLDVTALFAAVALLGAARAFETPTMSALLPALVPEVLLPKAFAVSFSAMQTATIIGSSLVGFLPSAPAVGCTRDVRSPVHIPVNRHVGIKMFAAVIIFGIATIIFSIFN
jgi:Transmembrane secretion effector